MKTAWDTAADEMEANDPNQVNRGTQAEVMCQAYGGGNVPCSPQTPEETVELVQWMCGRGYTSGYTGKCDQITTIKQAEEEYGQDKPMTQAQSWSFNARAIEDTGYTPPFGYTQPSRGYQPPPGSPCINGLTVMQAHAAADDNGCRPPQCDFGRAADGWCLPPANTDPPVVYVLGPGEVGEDQGTANFRIGLSHAVPNPVSVTVSTADGTATAGADYTAVNRTVTVPRNYLVTQISVPVLNDSVYDPNETFMVQLSNPSRAALSTNPEADVTIRDEDPIPVLVSISDSTTVEEGGQLRFQVAPDVAPATGMSVQVRVADTYYRDHPLYLEVSTLSQAIPARA